MSNGYTVDFEAEIQDTRKAIKDSKRINPKTKKVIEEYFEDYVLVHKIKLPTQRQKLKSLKRLFELKTFEKVDVKSKATLKDDCVIKDAIRELEKSGKNRKLNTWTYGKELKCFFKWVNLKVNDSYDCPKCVRWIDVTIKDNDITRDELFTPKEIEKIARYATNIRDKALIYVLYESTCRANEFLQLKVKDVIHDQYGMKVRITQGKTKKGSVKYREVRLLKSVHYLNLYLEGHPNKKNPNAPLWVNIDRTGKNLKYLGNGLNYHALNKCLRSLVSRAGIKKKANPQRFRMSILTEYARTEPESITKKLGGHAQDSRAVKQYYKINDNDTDEALLKRGRVKVKKRVDEVDSLVCGRCRTVNEKSYEFCGKCSYPLTSKRIREESKHVDDMKKQMEWMRQEIRGMNALMVEMFPVDSKKNRAAFLKAVKHFRLSDDHPLMNVDLEGEPDKRVLEYVEKTTRQKNGK